MREVFADTSYWIALLLPTDDNHAKALEVSQSLTNAQIVTTDSVMIELFNFFGERGEMFRTSVSALHRSLMADNSVTILPQERKMLTRAINLYDQRKDKGYSLTDCFSMSVMRERGMDEILTADHHFEQEGLIALLRLGA